MDDKRPTWDLNIEDGWKALAEWTGGQDPETLGPLAALHALGPVFPLLQTLAGRSPRDFFARAAVLRSLAGSAQRSFSPEDLDERLRWLLEPARSQALDALREGGWLELDSTAGPARTVLTAPGLRAPGLLSFLQAIVEPGPRLPARPASPEAGRRRRGRPAAGEVLTGLAAKILSILERRGGMVAMGELSLATGEIAVRLRAALDSLAERGYVRRTGERGATRYHLVRPQETAREDG